MPTRAEFDEAMDKPAKEVPGGSLQKAIEEAMDEIPEGEELNKAVEKSLEELEKSAKETREGIKKNRLFLQFLVKNGPPGLSPDGPS